MTTDESRLEFSVPPANESAPSMLLLLALFLAGLGLFFHGLTGLRQSMQGLASRRVRTWLARWSGSPALAGLWGFCLGGLTQSVTAVAFIVASLVGGGLLTVPRALPVVACANLGTAALVLVASFDVHVAVLLVLGVMGVAAAFEIGGRSRAILTALFFAALLFFGLHQMREAFGPLPAQPWFARLASIAQASMLATFVLGAILRLFIQSSPAIAIIAIAFCRGGILTPEQAIAMMFGTGLGVGGAVFLLGSNLRGVPRQIALYQALLSMSACLLMGGLFGVERFTGWPLLVHRLAQLPGNESLRLAYAFVAMQLAAVVLAALTSRRAAALLERLSPPTLEQDLGRPEYLQESALDDPESALVLADREQRRLLARLPLMLDAIRHETEANAAPAEALRAATTSVAGELREFLDRVGRRTVDPATSDRWLELQRRQALVSALSETAYDFVTAGKALRSGANGGVRLLPALAEGLHALTATVVEAVEQPAVADRALLLAMTADRGEMMERIRGRVLAATPELGADARLQLVYLTSLFERQVWLLRQLAQTLPVAPTPSAAVPSTG